MSKASPRDPFVEPSLVGTYAARESVKLRVKPSSTLRPVTQIAMGATPQWSGLGPRQILTLEGLRRRACQ